MNINFPAAQTQYISPGRFEGLKMKISVRFKEILGLPTENNLFSHRVL
jgi:hypothetical protein